MSLLRRPVRVRLHGRRAVTGQIHIPEGQALSAFLTSKQFFVNLTDVRWEDAPEADPLPHLSVRLAQIVWVEPADEALHLSTAAIPSDASRKVELYVDSGLRLQVELNVAQETRMTDYLDANAAFLPLWSVQVPTESRTIERVLLNHSAIEVIRELAATDPSRSAGERDRAAEDT